MNNPTLDIVIVNWNSGTQLRDCLMSIASASKRGVTLERVIVVDNGSHDGSGESIDAIDLPLTVMGNRCNNGFSRACNQGARSGNGDCILFLNPDIRLFDNSLDTPVTFLMNTDNDKTGIVGIQLVDGAGKVSRSCARFPTPRMMLQQMVGLDRLAPGRFPGHFLDQWDHGDSRCVDQVMGAFYLVRRNLFEKLNGFDERFFVYYEDLDFSLRAKKQGYSSWFLAEAAAFHKGCGTTDHARKERLCYYLASRIRYGLKHFGKMQGMILTMATLFLEPWFRLVMVTARDSGKGLADALKGYGMLAEKIPGLIGKRGNQSDK